MKNINIHDYIKQLKVHKRILPVSYIYWSIFSIKESNFKKRYIKSINSNSDYIVNFHKPIL